MSARTHTTIEVEDPETGETMTLVAVKSQGGKEFYRRLPAANFDLALRSPRQLEATAAFAETASRAFGQKSSPTEPAANRVVRQELAHVFPKAPKARERRGAAKQAAYRALLGSEVDREIRRLDSEGIGLRLRLPKRRPGPPSLAQPRRLEEIPAPSAY